jgi:DNA modification methylase
MDTPIIDSKDLANSWKTVGDREGNYRTRGLPFRYLYIGSFSQALAEYFIRVYSNVGDAILDPFSGRGTVAMQALYHQRNVICNDLSAYSNTLCHSILYLPHMADVVNYIDELELYINKNYGEISAEYYGKGEENDVAKLYHPETFGKIVRLKNTLNSKKFLFGRGLGKFSAEYEHEVVMFIRAVITQLILASSLSFNGLKVRGTDNTSVKGILRYFVALKEKPQQVDIFENMKIYVNKMNLDGLGLRNKLVSLNRRMISCDAKMLDIPSGSVDGVITSPPYFKVLSYGKSNWARLWTLDNIGDPLIKTLLPKVKESDSSEIYGKLYDKVTDHTFSTKDNAQQYSSFTGFYLKEIYRVLKNDAFAVIIVGDYGSKKKMEAWKLVKDRAELFGFKTNMVIMDRLNVDTKSSSQFNVNEGGGKNDYDVCIVLYKGKYEIKNNPKDIDFRWKQRFADSSQRDIEAAWGV